MNFGILGRRYGQFYTHLFGFLVSSAIILAAPAAATPQHRTAARPSPTAVLKLPNARWLAGSWIRTAQDASDCSSPFRSFRMDRSGALMSMIGIGNWSMSNDRLHIVAQSPTQGSTDEILTISAASANAFTLTDSAGSQLLLRRCSEPELGDTGGLVITPSRGRR